MRKILKTLEKYALPLAFFQAWIATLGSLYYSEVLDLTPCLLCWWQRILMYPLVIILPVAIIRKDKNVAYYVLPLSFIGASIALYQYLLQMTPLAAVNPITCSIYQTCSQIDKIYLGFVTIPFLSLIAFLIITMLMLLVVKNRNRE